MERSYTDLAWLKADTEVKLELTERGFTLRTIIAPATTLYDCQLCWTEEDGSVVITDIGGQAQPGWDREKGHGAVFKLHPDNRIEPIVPYGNTGRAMIMSTIKSPANFGEYSNRPSRWASCARVEMAPTIRTACTGCRRVRIGSNTTWWCRTAAASTTANPAR
ncbi:MAG: hypothetical protein ABW034_03770 [Steroidobacteraceae bacterium]